jgi:IS5 family transposase
LLEAWAGQKSFTRKDGTSPGPSDDDPGNPTVNFHGERRSNATHQSTTDRDSRLAKKSRGSDAKLAYLGEVLMDNRHGLIVDACVMHATGTAERDAATGLLAALPAGHATVGADKLYDTYAWVATTRQFGITPHVAQKPHSAIDRRTTRHPGYEVSQRVRKRVEEIFGWMKTIGGLRKLRHRGGARVEWQFLFVAAAYNLVRLRNLPARPA